PPVRIAQREDEGDLVSLCEGEAARDTSLFGAKVEGGSEVDGHGAASKAVAVVHARHGGNLAGIVEDRPAVDLDLDRSANAANETNDLMVFVLLSARGGVDRHEIDDLADPVRRQKPGQQNVRIGQVHLAVPGALGGHGDAEVPAFLVVENRS